MDSLTEREMARIARLQRDAGVHRLSCHFTWPEFCDERRCFHQEFVYDVAIFALDRGFSWPNVIRAAVIARDLFPQLDDLDAHRLLSLLRGVLCERLPNLTPVHRHEFTQYLINTYIARRRLFQAVIGGAANMSIAQLHLEVQLPPTPCPLAQGTDLHEWEAQQRQARLSSTLQEKEEELRCLRDGARVTLGVVSVPEEEHLDEQSISELVRAAVRAAEAQILASLNQEATLLCDIQQLKLQQVSLATRGRHNTSNTRHISRHPDAKAKSQTAKTRSGLKESGNAV